MNNEVHSLRSNQEETDTRVVLYIMYAQDKEFKFVVVRTPDSDIFMILLHHANSLSITIHLDIGVGKHRRLVNMTELADGYGQDWCTTLLAFYVFTGEDCTSAFKGKGKVSPLKRLMKYQKYFQKLGDEWTVDEETLEIIEAFTCNIYGYAKESDVNVVRSKMRRDIIGKDTDLSRRSKVELAHLPPCEDTLIPHIQRVNHRVACYKRADIPIFEKKRPSDAGQGCCLN